MKVTSQNQNNYTSLSKRPKSGEKDKYQTIINTKIQTKNKYASYFQSPNKGEDLLFIKKKFQKMKKNSKEKSKNKTSNNNNNSNTHTNISSSRISFMSPINKNYCNKKQNFALTKFLKNKLILNSIDSTSFVTSKEKVIPYNNNSNNCGNLSNILKCNITKNNKLVNNKENNMSNNINPLSNNNVVISKMVSVDFSSNKICTPESSNNNHNRTESNYSLNLNKQTTKDMNKNKKNRSSITSINSKNKENTHRDRIKEKISIKDKDNTNCKTIRKSCRFNFFNNNNNENLNQNKLYSYKGMINNKKNNKNNYSNSNQNFLSNTVFEYNKSQQDNNINFFENYVKAVAMNKNNNKYTYNNSISINKSSNFNNISNKKNNHNITYTSNNVSNVNTNRETNTNSINENKNLFPGSLIHSPKSSNISKTTKSSPKSSLINLNKKYKGHIKNKSISIITKNETSLLFKGNNLNNNENGPVSNHNNHKYKINYNNNINYSTTHSKTNSNNINGNNLYAGYGNQYKYSLSKKLNLVDIGNNNKKAISSPYNVYYKKKTQPNSNENTIIHSNKNKINLSKNNNNINTTGNNSKNKNIYINKNHFHNHKNLSSLNNSTQYYYNNFGQNKDSEISSPTNNNNHQNQKTENIIVNNYNININNQIQNNSFFSNNIMAVDSKKGNNKNNNNKNQICITNQNNNNIPPKQNLKKKKIFSQSLKDILISNNKNAKNFTTNNSPINKLEILLNTKKNNNNAKNNNEIYSDNKIDSNNNNNKFTYKKWSSNRDKIKKDTQKKKVFESISSRKKEESKINNKIKMDNNKIINSQRKYIDLKKRITEEMENETKKKKNCVKNGNNKEKDIYNKMYENNINNNRNTELSSFKYNPTLSSRSSTSYDANYYMKESLKLSCYISKYYNKYKKYPETSLQFYKYGRLIGQGAFGKVNLGLNILTGRIVAVKSFNKNNSELTGDNMKKIKYETDLMKKLNHPNITKILEMFEDEKYFLIIMEYINGGNLFSFVKKRRKLSEKTAKFLFRQIILGIKYIHEQNIVHRDIKLENLLIDLNNNVKICDFGIGRKLENKKQLLHDQCGTLMYMAPEILLSSKEKGYEGFPVDIWSAGISLYIMLSGTLPFNYKNKKKNKNNEEEDDDDEEEEEEESISNSKSKSKKNDDDNFELQYNIVYKEPKHIEKISDEARDLLKGLLNKNPKKRFTCEQILNHPWLYNFKEKYNSSNKFHLFTKAEMIMLSKTFIDYRRANYDDLKENFTLSNLENESDKNNLNEQNITSKSSILAPYNSIISDYDNSSASSIIKHNNDDSFDDFNNSKIKLEKDQIVFSKKIKEYNRLYELNNNGEVDNGVLINSKTQSSVNISERSNNSRIENKIKDSDMNLNFKGSFVIFDENEDEVYRIKETKQKIEDITVKNDNGKNLDEEIEHKIKSNNILNQMSIMGYDKKYVLDCVEKNELCHASTVYYLMMNYENI